MRFKFDLGQDVEIKVTNQKGYIEGRAEYLEDPSVYWVVYKNGAGNLSKEWFKESDLR